MLGSAKVSLRKNISSFLCLVSKKHEQTRRKKNLMVSWMFNGWKNELFIFYF